MALDQGTLDQLIANYSGRELGDQMQMAKFRQSQGGVASPVADVPVQSQNLAPPSRTMGDGRPVVNKGVQVASADTSSPTPMASIIDKAAGDDVSARAKFETNGSPVTPGRKPLVNSSQYKQGNIDRAKQGALRQGVDPILAMILQRLQQKPMGTQGQQKPSMGVSP